MNSRSLTVICSVLAGAAFTGSAFAQQFVYPKNNQTPEQQKKDEFDCHTWAVQQTGYDPIAASQQAAAPAATAPSTGQGAVRGAAKGAALGAAVGAVAGDAGKGAAIGATAGGVGGGMKARGKQADARAANQAATSAQDSLKTRYNAARSACLEGKGYTVK